MKKIIILILAVIITGCNNQLNIDKKTYQSLVKELNNINIKNKQYPFDIKLELDKIIDSEITYRLIIDKPKQSLKNIMVLVIHDSKTKDIFPSIGIFDSKVNLIPNDIDVAKNNVKGIALVGYIPYPKQLNTFRGTFKVLIKYNDNRGYEYKTYYQYQI
jgi:hypothetical protein